MRYSSMTKRETARPPVNIARAQALLAQAREIMARAGEIVVQTRDSIGIARNHRHVGVLRRAVRERLGLKN
jgi:hypothetical protein